MKDTHGSSGQYLSFTLAEEVFALDIATVREVLEMTGITRVPGAAPSMRGVLNLRGHAVPVMDLRTRFGMPVVPATVNTCIVIMETSLAGDATVLGLLVDSVHEVMEIAEGDLMPPPRMGAVVETEVIRNMARQGEGFAIILDAGRIFSAKELAGVAPDADQKDLGRAA